jgi:hypothetical protein
VRHRLVKTRDIAPRQFFSAAAVLFAVGVLIQFWLGGRGGIRGDQYVLLDLGLDYLESGELSAVGKGMSGGGFIPGSLLQLLIGVPFSLWHDYRSPVVLIGLFHLLAGIVVLRTVHRAVGPRAALLFLIVYWLSPWRLYHSGFLWEPAYVVLPAALHLWACFNLREEPNALASALLGATLVMTFQLHGSFLYLVIVTAVLLMRKLIRLQWAGGFLGAAVGALPLIPTLTALAAGTMPPLGPSKSFLGYGLVTVVPLLRGVAYWFRLGSLNIGRRLQSAISGDVPWEGDGWLTVLLRGGAAGLIILSAASVLVALAASWWYFRRARGREGRPQEWLWLRSYALSGLVAVVISSALSPVTIQGWHLLIALPAACLPVAIWMDEVWPSRRRLLWLLLVLFLFLRIPEIAVIGLGHEMYTLSPSIASELDARKKTLLPEGFRESE